MNTNHTTGSTDIRPAEACDAARVAELIGEMGHPVSEAIVRRRIVSLASSPTDRIAVAKSGDTLVGVISVHLIPLLHENSNVGRITLLVVGERYRRQGIGRLLVAEAQRFAASHGGSRMEVVSRDNRPDAHRFYESLGYRLESKRFVKRGA